MFFLFAAVLLPASLAADEYALKPLEDEPPKEVPEKIRKELQPGALRVVEEDGDPFVDLWLRKEVATRDPVRTLGIDYGHLPEGTLLGVIRFHGREKDFRGNRFPPGIYTLRTAIQPQDGDHIGVSETRDFVVLAPVKEDEDPKPIAHEPLVELAVKVTGTKHPSILYLTKMFDKPKKLPRVVEDTDREFWILDVEVPEKGKEKKTVRLSIVLVGRAPEAF